MELVQQIWRINKLQKPLQKSPIVILELWKIQDVDEIQTRSIREIVLRSSCSLVVVSRTNTPQNHRSLLVFLHSLLRLTTNCIEDWACFFSPCWPPPHSNFSFHFLSAWLIKSTPFVPPGIVSISSRLQNNNSQIYRLLLALQVNLLPPRVSWLWCTFFYCAEKLSEFHAFNLFVQP